MIKRDKMWGTTINPDAERSIYAYCTKRNYKCKGCKFSIDKYTDKHSKYATCLFANCPCTWFKETGNE